MKLWHYVLGAIVALLCLGARPALADDPICAPATEKHSTADTVLARVLTSSRIDNHATSSLQSAIRQLRHDGLSNAAIIDHAVAVYCPLLVKDSSLSVMQKREALRDFASQTTAIVYDPGKEEYIVMSVPVTTALSDRIAVASANANESSAAWIRQAIAAHLDGR